MIVTIVSILLFCLAGTVCCSEILMVSMPNGKSHSSSTVPLLSELIRQGHNVTIYMEQYGDAIDFGNGIKQWYINITNHTLRHSSAFWRKNYLPSDLNNPFYEASVSCGYVMDEYRNQLLRISEHSWDLILVDSLFSTCGYGIVLRAGTNYVMIHTTSVEAPLAFAKGYARQFATSPPFCMLAEDADYNAANFRDRLYLIYEWYILWYVITIKANLFMRWILAPIIPHFDYITFNQESSMSFTDMPLQLYFPESRTNELFLYGAYCKPSGNLTGELVSFVTDSRSRGTIVMAFGTILDWKEAPTDRREAFVEALNQLQDYRIIWACRNCPSMKTGSHIRLLNWLPQQELLNHPQTKLFITHGGLKSVKEAACAKMPTLFLPVFGEQVRNAYLAKYHGFGQIINKFNITTGYLLHLIKDMLTNPIYKRKAEEMKGYFVDTPIPALQEGAFWIKRLIKYGGRMPEYFYTRSRNLTNLQYFNIDFMLLIPIGIYFLILIK